MNIQSINVGTGIPGVATFNMLSTYQWTLVSAASITGFSASDFALNTSGFTNSLGGGSFSISAGSSAIFLNFTPVPEPSTWALLATGAAAVAWTARRRHLKAKVL